ncbi:MAG TPA: helix-turn-helix domain-containing protein [Fimbriimonadaceae bacterium]|nr:helix-turn-helix domain-containing protein [Fimbriimonadaceae bacterium]
MKSVNVPLIESDADLRVAIERLKDVFDAVEGPEADEAEGLSIMIQDYERRTIPMSPADPVEAIRFAMEQRGYTWSDLAKALGSQSRASEIMNRRRALNLRMIRALHAEFKIPLESLVAEGQTGSAPRQKAGRKRYAPGTGVPAAGTYASVVRETKSAFEKENS